MYIPTAVIIALVIIGFFYYKRKINFSPFYIHISPNWYELLKDYNLVNDETWKKLDEFYSKQPNGYNVFKYGISFTVLGLGGSPYLIYNNNWKSFSSKVDFREEIEGITIQQEGSPHFPFSPTFWVKHGIEGYEIGITTPESIKKRYMVGDDTELIKIAILPYSLFHLSEFRFGVAKPKKVEEQLKEHGWSRDEDHEKLKKDVLFPVPEELNHKYFTVEYDYI